GETAKLHATIIDTAGHLILDYHRRPAVLEPRWPYAAIASRELRSDTLSLGPIESAGGVPAYTFIRPLYDSLAKPHRLVGYYTETRSIVATNVQQLRDLIGPGIEFLVGEPGVGAWTDLQHVAAAPAEGLQSDTVRVDENHVGATARVPGTHWVVWLAMPKRFVLAPS